MSPGPDLTSAIRGFCLFNDPRHHNEGPSCSRDQIKDPQLIRKRRHRDEPVQCPVCGSATTAQIPTPTPCARDAAILAGIALQFGAPLDVLC
jgi:hypothetical protein